MRHNNNQINLTMKAMLGSTSCNHSTAMSTYYQMSKEKTDKKLDWMKLHARNKQQVASTILFSVIDLITHLNANLYFFFRSALTVETVSSNSALHSNCIFCIAIVGPAAICTSSNLTYNTVPRVTTCVCSRYR